MCWWTLYSTNKRSLEKSRLTTAMRRSFILLCVISRVSLEMQAVHNIYLSRKGRSNSPPIYTGYVHNQFSNQPSSILTFDNKGGREKQFGDKAKRIVDDLTTTKKPPECSSELKISDNTSKKPLITTPTKNIEKIEVKKYSPKRNVLFEELEAEPNYNLPSYEKNQFRNDEEDVRTESINSNDGWPLFYHSPYEYEPMKFDNEIQKAQDKRFIVPEDTRIIPIHGHIKHDIIENQIYSGPDSMYTRQTLTTDNPILGDQPFFSYVLNDYFDKTDNEEPFPFKGLSWGEEFDQEMPFHDIDDYAKRIRRLEDDLPSYKKVYDAEADLDKGSLQVKKRSDSYHSKQGLENNTNGNKNEQNHNSYHNYNGVNNRGFKNFADYFANKFGSEDHNNISKHNVKNNFDKGEKKKGFRNLYHKDEYQENTVFHDSNDKKVEAENKGQSKVHLSGSEAVLNSQAAAATGNEKSRIGKNEDYESQKFLRNNKSHHQKRNYNNLNQYRDVAKSAAMSNNADYIDRFMM